MKKILVYDSGIGGLNILSMLTNRYEGKYYYFADNKNTPYGQYDKKKLRELADENIKKLLKKIKIDILVLACNTISLNAFEHIKKKFPNLEVVGTFPVTENINEKTLFMSTTATYNIIKRNLKIKKENIFHDKYIAADIENNISDFKSLTKNLRAKLKEINFKNIENVILGCTHFNFIKSSLNMIARKKLHFISGERKVVKNLKRQLCASCRKNSIKFLFSKNSAEEVVRYERLFNRIHKFKL